MMKVRREGERTERALAAELRAREERMHRYDSERPDYNEEEEEERERELPQFMAAGVISDEGVLSSLEYSDLFDLDDPALEAELQLMSSQISESVEEMRRL